MSALKEYLEKKIAIITTDGRLLVGKLEGFDQATNLIISSTHERIITSEEENEPSSTVSLGLYLLKGNNVATVGLLDEEVDAAIDWEKVHGKPLKEATIST
ncbi:uncharacterized protein SAPINGB_P001405 [Magnusiomyces paraingens]|uniref:LSM2-LSM8 complex subunit LSM8 n=1 Tax=Magnusiomyces paraingens TaxID=2606893 RepID=A0A5E8B5K1_9ASCO|nr:uncharacterized protein SAPINGB_P001405 [Saprochaete ingens]VVT46825.1 unnamed protein product [Saprochaete ingens]